MTCSMNPLEDMAESMSSILEPSNDGNSSAG